MEIERNENNNLNADNDVNVHINQYSSKKNRKNLILVTPIIYGSVAISLGKKSTDTATHKWCLYVRGNNNENLSYLIKEVSFTLHNSFKNHVRVINKHPFRVYESGWGEFDVKVQITLKDPNFRAIEFVHFLKLHPNSNQISSSKKPVINENYEEIVIVNPRLEFFPDLALNPVTEEIEVNSEFKNNDINEELQLKDREEDTDDLIFDIENLLPTSISDENDYKALEEINNFITSEITKSKEALEVTDKSLFEIKKKLRDLYHHNTAQK